MDILEERDPQQKRIAGGILKHFSDLDHPAKCPETDGGHDRPLDHLSWGGLNPATWGEIGSGVKVGIDNPWNRYDAQGSIASAADFFRFPPLSEPWGGMAGFDVSASVRDECSFPASGVVASFLP